MGVGTWLKERIIPPVTIVPQRIIDPTTMDRFGVDLLALSRNSAANRRWERDNYSVTESWAAAFAAVQFIATRVTRPEVLLQRKVAGEWIEVGQDDHPAALMHRRINAAITWKDAIRVAAMHCLTAGNAYWVKRRTGLQVPVVFEMIPPALVELVREKDNPTNVLRYKIHRSLGTVEVVEPENMIPFRGLPDPRDPIKGLAPLTAARLDAEAAMESQRFNLRFFDQGGHPGETFAGPAMMPVDAQRLEDELNRKYTGVDNAHRLRVLPGDMKPILTTIPPKDMEFLALQKWSVIQVARAFDLSPLALKDFDRATYENAPEAGAQDWARVLEELRNLLDDLNEWCIKPDFGEDLRLWAPGDDIEELQTRRKEQAEIDAIYASAGVHTINEIRERNNLDTVPWGDISVQNIEQIGALIRAGFLPDGVATILGVPGLPHSGLPPVTVQSVTKAPDPDRSRSIPPTPNIQGDAPGTLKAERTMADRWAGRLANERRGIMQHLQRESQRVFGPDDVESYNWDWFRRYGESVAAELAGLLEIGLEAGGFVETPMLSAQQLARDWAAARSAEMIQQVSHTTREGIRQMVAETIESGASLQDLMRELRTTYLFDRSRAEAIARTETAEAMGRGRNTAARSEGRDLKRWRTARDDRVSPTICAPNESQGWIPINETFQSGHDREPGHVRCRCRVDYRTKAFEELPR